MPENVPKVTFSPAVRFVIGLAVGVITYLLNGEYVRIPEAERALITSVFLVLSSAGFVPPTPATILEKIPPVVHLVLLVLVPVAGYLLNVFADLEPILRGLLLGLLAFLSTVVVVPPQVVVDPPPGMRGLR